MTESAKRFLNSVKYSMPNLTVKINEEDFKVIMDPLNQANELYAEKIKIKQNTNGDSRVAKSVPTIEDFDKANHDHQDDVKRLCARFMDILNSTVSKHDWTKTKEPYRSMFYADLCATINGKLDFETGEWALKHYNELERHHLNRRCPDDVNLFDVIEMMCDCIAAGLARSGKVYDLELSPDILEKAFKNTVEIMKNQVEVSDQYGMAVEKMDIPMVPNGGPSFHGESWYTCPRCKKTFEYWDTVNEHDFKHDHDNVYRHECGQLIKMI